MKTTFLYTTDLDTFTTLMARITLRPCDQATLSIRVTRIPIPRGWLEYLLSRDGRIPLLPGSPRFLPSRITRISIGRSGYLLTRMTRILWSLDDLEKSTTRVARIPPPCTKKDIAKFQYLNRMTQDQMTRLTESVSDRHVGFFQHVPTPTSDFSDLFQHLCQTFPINKNLSMFFRIQIITSFKRDI